MRTDYFSSGQRWLAFGIESKNGVNKNIIKRRIHDTNESNNSDSLNTLIVKESSQQM